MKKNISEKIKSVPPSGIREFFELVIGMDEVISLGVGEPDFITPWRIREAGVHSLESGYTSYTSNKGLLELRELISKNVKQRYSKSFDPEKEILITTGVSEGYDLVIRSLIETGDEVIIIEPSYVSYKPCIKFCGGKVNKIETNFENNFIPNIEEIQKNITDKTKAIVLNYPNNPTGSYITQEKLNKIIELAKKNNLVVISDEIYNDIVYSEKKASVLNIDDIKENLVLLNGFSKAYAMTGWRIGYALGNKEIISAMNKIHQYTMLCTPIISQKAAIEALRNAQNDVDDMIDKYCRRRKLVLNKLQRIGLRHKAPEGAFYVFPSIKKTGLSSEEFAKKLLKEKNVAVVPGTAFGEAGEGFVRMSFATSRDELNEAFNRINEFVKDYV